MQFRSYVEYTEKEAALLKAASSIGRIQLSEVAKIFEDFLTTMKRSQIKEFPALIANAYTSVSHLEKALQAAPRSPEMMDLISQVQNIQNALQHVGSRFSSDPL